MPLPCPRRGPPSLQPVGLSMDDPISSDPALLWYWSRLVGVLVVLLAIALGATDATTVDLSSLTP